jgi:hypothetical protein
MLMTVPSMNRLICICSKSTDKYCKFMQSSLWHCCPDKLSNWEAFLGVVVIEASAVTTSQALFGGCWRPGICPFDDVKRHYQLFCSLHTQTGSVMQCEIYPVLFLGSTVLAVTAVTAPDLLLLATSLVEGVQSGCVCLLFT